MSLSTARLDRFISEHCNISRRAVRLMLAKKRIVVDNVIADDIGQRIDKFSKILLDGHILQDNLALYIMLNKPIGVVSATIDKQHKTVIDLLVEQNLFSDSEEKDNLHIVGRLDLNTSGLLLLTNDSRWSARLMSPEHKVEKCYQVTLQNPLTDDYQAAFAKGMYFDFEDITTKPAKLNIISNDVDQQANQYMAEVKLIEGRYHQIKRMFGRFGNPVIGLHRQAIGNLLLDENLAEGDSRFLTDDEVLSIFTTLVTN
ncbi:pseudouridine synthase [Colwellia hornerae]|uniref:Pseudouridine synthase n=1 Tax=Colwellia hornerae TaxID=89402 RepID=A0A5C6Q6J8_9GAMM|nr:16S rRNA pseudouridine(516) synthase [Colwellia hornerae]TWX59505.1 16S rRNA pseudouridine(516) synthase [Colwellia hornerae]TWX62875.1 16S rRNA pseudouridine(516) synthase [Colwellia hornerae]TWX64197.1 16S rRNA pseudouridine(516) synthase [Colwellia hornerae]